MKAAHLPKIAGRADAALLLLFPEVTHRGEVVDPDQRLKELIRRLDGAGDSDLGNDINALRRLLEVDVPEMIQAVREANRETAEARAALAGRAGSTYTVTITSDSPMRVAMEAEFAGEQP